ncbi:MAG: hypothetical protein ACXV8K_04600 [Ilumatobacteraceae bacterium]
MSTTVREARAALGEAFAEANRTDDAIREIEASLKEPGDSPPAAELLSRLASLAGAKGDPLAALSYLFAGMFAALRGASWGRATADLAERILAVLDTSEGRTLAARLPTEQINEIFESASAPDAAPELARLALRVAYLAGATPATETLLASPALVDDPRAVTARTLESAWADLERGEASSALNTLDELSTDLAGEEEVSVARAFAYYMTGELEMAERELVPSSSSFLAAVLRTLIELLRAVDLGLGSDDQKAKRKLALDVATEATRNPAGDPAEAVLLRAQAMLESGTDLAEARRLVTGFLRRRQPSDVRWWRLQARTRHDDVFTFVQTELAGAQELDDFISSVADLPLATTTYLQDGAIAERRAEAHTRAGQIDRALERYEQAAKFYDLAVEPGATDYAVDVRARAQRLRPSAAGALELSEALWRRTYDNERTRSARLDDATSALDALDAICNGLDSTQVIKYSYVRGRVLARRQDLTDGISLDGCWAPLTWLLVTVLGDPNDPYPAGHLAWALNAADMHRASLYFAEQAFRRSEKEDGEPDSWLVEAFLAARFTWYGCMDERAEKLLGERTDDDSWATSVRLYVALLAGDLDQVRSIVERVQWSDTWAKSIEASAVAIIGDRARAEEKFVSLLTDCLATGDFSGASDAALALGRIADARDLLARAVDAKTISPERGESDAACIDLIENPDGGAIDVLARWIEGLWRPFELSAFAKRWLPLMVAIFPDPRLASAAARLNDLISNRLQQLASLPMPALGSELDAPGFDLVDPDLSRRVLGLLRVAQLVEVGDTPRTVALLDDLRVGSEPVLAQALELLRGNVVQLGSERLEASER